MAADDTFEVPDERTVLEQARRRCGELIEQLRRDAGELGRPSRLLTGEALAEGRAACDGAAAAAEQLMRRLDESLQEKKATPDA